MNGRPITGLLVLAGMMSLAFLHRPRQTIEFCPACLNAAALGEDSSAKPSTWDIPAARLIADPYPVFNGIAVDTMNDLVAMSDPNRKSLLLYDRSGGEVKAAEATRALRQIIGPETNIGMVAGVSVDPHHHEIFAVNNDIEDTMLVMSYAAAGNARPLRLLSVPHQAWGLVLSHSHDEIAVSVEISNAVVFYRREANGVEAPQQVIRGPHTGLADPHGIYWDDARDEIGVANHGNFRGLVRNTGSGCVPAFADDETAEAGEFRPPSITIYSATSKDDQAPLRTIQGARTELDWPMGIAVDPAHNEIIVANNGDNSILTFARNRSGNVAPMRIIRGGRTGINRPMGLAIDMKHDEIWVSNFADHSAVAFDRVADGDVVPKRIIRSAAAGTPSAGLGNPMALAYDCKREEILVPN